MPRIKTGSVFLVITAVALLAAGCEIPESPDFKTSQKVEAQLIFNKEYQFLGGDGALIDTTSSDFDSLFTVGPNQGITISQEEDFDFGDLNDAIPAVDADPASFSSEMGELEIGSFSSGGGNLGEASFQELTGFDPGTVPAGTAIPPGQSPQPANIDVGSNSDFFVSATVKEGGIILAVTNNLGFNIDQISVTLNSGAQFVENTTINDVNHGVTTSQTMTFDNGEVLSNLNVDVSVSWNAQTTQAEPGNLIVENIEGDNLVASQVQAALESQEFSSTNVTSVSAEEFLFTSPGHYIQLSGGTISIDPIQSGLDITVNELEISFPDIRRAPYDASDSLLISYSAGVPRNAQSVRKEIDLSGFRIYAEGNEVSYSIRAVTENTQDAAPGNQIRTLNENQEISSGVEITGLEIQQAFGVIKQQFVLLNDDEGGDDNLDLFNDQEAETVTIDGLDELSENLDGLEFTNPTISVNYTSNIGVPVTVYGAFVGTASSGERVYLSGSGRSGEYEVMATDPVGGLRANGVQLEADQMIKFELETAEQEAVVNGSITFNKITTNVDDFLNNLPNDIRFIGKAVVNQDENEGTVATPLEFDPEISVNIPLAFKSDGASFTDTTDQDLSDLPSPENGDNTTITEGVLTLDYGNGLPLGFEVELNFLDENDQIITSVPVNNETIEVSPADVDPVTLFSTGLKNATATISLNKSQLDVLYRTRKVEFTATLNTTNAEDVRIRATDILNISVGASFTIQQEVN